MATRPKRSAGETRRLVEALRNQGLSYSQIASRLGVGKSVVAYHARRLGIEPDERCNRRYDWAQISERYAAGASARQCSREFGFTMSSWYDAVRRGDIVPRPREMPIEDLLTDGRLATGRKHLKGRLFAAGLKSNACERCGLADWRDMPLSMALHHRNGRRHDNRLENLEILCPNCHSQTENFSGRNARRGAGE